VQQCCQQQCKAAVPHNGTACWCGIVCICRGVATISGALMFTVSDGVRPSSDKHVMPCYRTDSNSKALEI